MFYTNYNQKAKPKLTEPVEVSVSSKKQKITIFERLPQD
jgi:hypothetical protein